LKESDFKELIDSEVIAPLDENEEYEEQTESIDESNYSTHNSTPFAENPEFSTEIPNANKPEFQKDTVESKNINIQSGYKDSFIPHHAYTIIPTNSKIKNNHQNRIERNFYKMIEPKTNFTSLLDEKNGTITIGTQTNDIQFGPKVDTEYLLGDVRPWGKQSELLPKKGAGLYWPRIKKKLSTPTKPNGIEELAIGIQKQKSLRS
jgi:hypothetical protein